MTLILTLTNPAYTLQVSDRLLTQGDKEFDPFANKALIFWARDALVSVGYSGLAYIGGEPTDHWLAEQLSGEKISERGIRLGSLSHWSDLGSALIRLLRALNRLPQSWRHYLGEVVVAGWQWPRRHPTRMRQVLWAIQSPDRGGEYAAAQLVARHLPDREKLRLFYVPRGTPVTSSEVEGLVQQLPSYGPQGHDDAEAALVAEVRRVRTRTLAVGPHCTSIVISRFLPSPRVRYHAEGQHSLVLREGPPLPVAFTPWLIGPDVIAPPSVAVGGAFDTLGNVQVSIEVPPLPEESAVKMLFHSQDRPARPGWRPGVNDPGRRPS